MNDDQLLMLLRAHSPQALDELSGKYGPACRQLAEHILHDPQEAEECVSDALLALWNTAPVQAAEKLFPYLLKTVRNISIARLRRNSAAKRAPAATVPAEELADCLPAKDNVEKAFDEKMLRDALNAFLRTLSVQNRVLFLRRYWFGDSCEEIARRLGLSAKNVSVRLTRLRAQLRDYLTKEDFDV